MIQQPRKPDPIPRLDRIQAGEGLSAAKANRSIDTLNRMTQGTRPVRQIIPTPRGKRGAEQAIRVRFQVMEDDYIEGLDDLGNAVFVAKPWLLRRTPFDSELADPPPLRDGVKYEYTDGATRQGIIPGDPNADPPIPDQTEDQIIIQQFFPGDVVYADRQDNTGVERTIIGDPEADPPIPDITVPIKLLMQSDGRAFAKVSGSSGGGTASLQLDEQTETPIPVGVLPIGVPPLISPVVSL